MFFFPPQQQFVEFELWVEALVSPSVSGLIRTDQMRPMGESRGAAAADANKHKLLDLALDCMGIRTQSVSPKVV